VHMSGWKWPKEGLFDLGKQHKHLGKHPEHGR
jgi:hypothetical protein